MVLGAVRPEMPYIPVPKKWDRRLDEGTVHGQSMADLGLLRQFETDFIWTESVHEKLFACYCLVVE